MNAASEQIICTLFDHRYLPRGLCMINSIRAHGGHQQVWVLCLSAECERALEDLALPNVHPLALRELERHIPSLNTVKVQRKPIEYYFTCMAALHRYIFDTVPEANGTMYVDADIQFFANPNLVFDAIGEAPVAVIPHNFPPALRERFRRFGLYNAGWSAFRRTPEGMACLDWWLARSIEWCHDYVDGDRYANQGYLMHFKEMAPQTKILAQKGFNCAPWNIGGYDVREENGEILVDGERLVFFHFHGLKLHYGVFYFDSHRDYGAPLTRLVRNRIYKPYVREMLVQERRVQNMLHTSNSAVHAPLPRGKNSSNVSTAMALIAWLRRQKSAAVDLLHRALDLAAGRPILVWRGRVW